MSELTEKAFPKWHIAAETAEEHEAIQTASGVRHRLYSAQSRCPIVHHVLQLAALYGWSGEDTYVYLAYHALVALERSQENFTEHLNRCVTPPFFVPDAPSTK